MFTPQVIHEHVGPWWNDIDMGNWFVDESSLAILPAESFGGKSGGIWGRSNEFGLRNSFVHTLKYTVTSYEIWPTASPPPPPIFIALKNPSPLPGLNPRTLGLVTSMLTIIPPRQHFVIMWCVSILKVGALKPVLLQCFLRYLNITTPFAFDVVCLWTSKRNVR
jgi:hypothetical protein